MLPAALVQQATALHQKILKLDHRDEREAKRILFLRESCAQLVKEAAEAAERDLSAPVTLSGLTRRDITKMTDAIMLSKERPREEILQYTCALRELLISVNKSEKHP